MIAGEVSSVPTAVVVGVPGAGVTTTARALGEALRLEVHDTDAIIEERLGAPVHELVVDLGEEKFRAAEAGVVAEVLGGTGVVGLGSGALAAAGTRLAELRDSGVPVVHLRLTPGTAMRRLGLSGLGSVSLPNPRAMWTAMAGERDAAFAAVATTSIDTTTMSAEEVLAAVLEVVRGDVG